MSRFFIRSAALIALFMLITAGCGPAEEPPPRPEPQEEVPSAAAEPAPREPAEEAAEKPSAGIALKVGVVIPLTGDVATYGDEAKKGILLAADEAKAAGAVSPEVLIVDNEGRQQATITAANKFIDTDHVHVIIGAITSNNSIAAGDRAEAAGVPMVTPASTNVDITRDKNYIFRVCFTDEFQGSAAADFVYDTLGHRRAAVLVCSSETYSMGLGTTFSEAFKRRGGQIVSHMSFPSETDDFSGQITQLRLKAPDVIFLPAYYEAVAKCISQARTAGLRATFMGTDGWDSPDLYTLSGGAVKGNYFTTHFSPDEERPIVKQFVQNYHAYYDKSPGAIAALSYDAARLVFDAAKRAGKADREAIKNALAATENFEGVTGNFSIDENHNPVKRLVVLETGEKSASLVEVMTP